MPDIILNGSEYQDLYALSGIDVGTRVIVQNKSIYNANIVKSSGKPSLDFKGGFLIKGDPKYTYVSAENEPGIWAFGKGPIGVEQV